MAEVHEIKLPRADTAIGAASAAPPPVAKPATPATEPPTPSLADQRKVWQMLDAHFVGLRWAPGWSDAEVARQSGADVAWVTRARVSAYGDARDDELDVVRGELAAARAMLAELERKVATIAEARQIDLSALGDIEVRPEAIAKRWNTSTGYVMDLIRKGKLKGRNSGTANREFWHIPASEVLAAERQGLHTPSMTGARAAKYAGHA